MIIKAALLLFREINGNTELLFVKPIGKSYYIFPGGKQEPGESTEQALVRELREELQVDAKDLKKIGIVSGRTPDDSPLEMHLFSAKVIGDPKPSAEIEEIAWFSQTNAKQNKEHMTPMSLDHVFPYLNAKNLW